MMEMSKIARQKAHIKMKIKTEIKTEIKDNNNKFICCSIDFIKSYCNNIEDLRNLQNAVNKFNSNVIKKGYLENK